MAESNKPAVKDALDFMEKNKARFVDLRFTDLRGQEQHMTITAHTVNEKLFSEGKMFDGSSIAGWKSINSSDMILMPDANTAIMDPFFDEPTLVLRCDVIEPMTMSNYERDPRSLAQRAIAYMNKSGIADTCYFGPEPEFNIFDEVRYENRIGGSFYQIDSEEAYWNTGADYDGSNLGHRPNIKGGYVPVPPVDSSQDLRSAMCVTLEEMGAIVEVHHHEVATANQNEIGVKFRDLLAKADEFQMLKYVIHNVAHAYGKTATFMPKPLVGDNGNGMHCHQSLAKGGKNLFAGDQYGHLSELALHYIGGIIKHGRTLNAFTNASTNSYKRLVPGFEAPVTLAYSARNRSAAIRIPFVSTDLARRIEVRFPDPTMNSYLAFSAMLMAGLDGIRNKIHPGEPMDENLFELPREQLQQLPTVCGSLKHALDALRQDQDFLLEGGVFTQDIIEAYIELKQQEVDQVRLATHPLEFELYYSL